MEFAGKTTAIAAYCHAGLSSILLQNDSEQVGMTNPTSPVRKDFLSGASGNDKTGILMNFLVSH